jgi:hypothetical protein
MHYRYRKCFVHASLYLKTLWCCDVFKVDNTTIGLSADALFLKDDSVSSTKLTSTLRNSFVNTRVQASFTNQNDGSGVYNTVVNHSGIGRLLGVYVSVLGGISPFSIIKITIDGTLYTLSNLSTSRNIYQSNGTTFGFTETAGSAVMDAMNILFSTHCGEVIG